MISVMGFCDFHLFQHPNNRETGYSKCTRFNFQLWLRWWGDESGPKNWVSSQYPKKWLVIMFAGEKTNIVKLIWFELWLLVISGCQSVNWKLTAQNLKAISCNNGSRSLPLPQNGGWTYPAAALNLSLGLLIHISSWKVPFLSTKFHFSLQSSST